MHSKIVIAILIMFFCFSGITLADTSGTLNFTEANTTGIVTGLYGLSYQFYCTINTSCISGDRCFIDCDHISSGSYTGWCKPSAETGCMHDGSWTATGGAICANSTHAESCSSGTWSETYCGNRSCSSGVCTTPSTTTSTSGSTTATTTTNRSEIKIKSYPSNFNITQGRYAAKNVTINNTGTNTLIDVRLIITGIASSYYSIEPSIITFIGRNTVKNFTITFAIPISADVGEFNVTVNASKNSTVYDFKSFKLKILPSNETVANLTPLYNDYFSHLSVIELNISLLGAKGANISLLESSLNAIKSKLSQANANITSGDYYTAGLLLAEARSLIDSLRSNVEKTTIPSTVVPPPIDIPWLYIGIAATVIVVVAVLAYLFWPEPEEGYDQKTGWKPPKRKRVKS